MQAVTQPPIAPTKIIHLSDLHFGTESSAVVDALLNAIIAISPDYIMISGDFTQIGSEKEFRAAHDFLQKLPCPVFCVPGNHDVPARNLPERFGKPYAKYQKYITQNLSPVFVNEHIVIAGINSARRILPHWNWANGAISSEQRQYLKTIFAPDEPRWTLCMFHHPIHKVDDMPLDVTVFGRKKTLQTIQDLKIDIVLTGHVHHASITTRGDNTHQSVYISASTALSSRKRGQENGFNLITLGERDMIIDIYTLQNQGFSVSKTFQQTKTS